jgi:hypothetical protein
MSQSTRVRVGRVVLEGFAPGEHLGVVAAIESALAGAEYGPPRDSARIEAAAPGVRPAHIGRAVAGAVQPRKR